jgi:putative endonuclease
MTFARLKTGKKGEELACWFLEEQGYRIIEKNYRTRFGEIDIIGDDKGFISFVEVRTRAGDDPGSPEDSIGFRKQNQIARSALAYIKSKHLEDRDCRFDVVCVKNINSVSPRMSLIKNAFELNSRYRY